MALCAPPVRGAAGPGPTGTLRDDRAGEEWQETTVGCAGCSRNPAVNPLMHDWNMVFIRYVRAIPMFHPPFRSPASLHPLPAQNFSTRQWMR